MKIESLKSLSLKGMFTKVAVAGVLAGAVFMAAPQKAEAQRVRFGIGFGVPVYGPAYYGPAYRPVYGPAFYGERRREEFRREEFRREEFRRQEFYHHEREEREHRFDRDYRR